MKSAAIGTSAILFVAALGLGFSGPEPTALAEIRPSQAVPMKDYDCGGKDQKPCPLQGWMKTVMARAAGGGEGDKLASALSYVAARPPPGMDQWASISQAAADKAKAGDIDGAKTSCKKCHALYQKAYKETMRDRPF